MHKTIFIAILFAFLNLVLSCGQNEFQFSLRRIYKTNSAQESLTIWKGDKTTGQQVIVYQGTSADGSKTYSYDICLEDTLYTFVMGDSGGTGWGATGTISSFTLFYNEIPVLYGQMPYSLYTSYKEEIVIFRPGFQKLSGTSVKYMDTPQMTGDWKQSSFDDSQWNTINSGSLPQHTAITRYYRTSFVPSGITEDTFSLNINVKTNCGFVVYVNGQEYKRYLMPYSAVITPSTTPLLSAQTNSEWITVEITKYSLSLTTPVTIAIETHRTNPQINIADSFDILVHLQYIKNNQCTLSRMDPEQTIYECSTAAYSSSYSCLRAFDSSPSTYFYTRYSSTSLTLSYNNDRSILINSYGIRGSATSSYGYPKAWTLYGYNDNQEPVILDKQTDGGITTTKQLKVFNLPSNRQTYAHYKLEITAGTSSGKVSIGDFELYSCNTPLYEDMLLYQTTVLNLREGSSIDPITPLSSGFTSYVLSSNATESTGLTIDSSTGIITGAFLISGTYNFTITASRYRDQTTSQYSFTVVSLPCSLPDNQPVRLTKIVKGNGPQESFIVYSATNEILYQSPAFVSNQNVIINLCLPATEISILMKDTTTSGWTDQATLTVEALTNGVYNKLAVAYLYQRSQDTLHLNFKPAINPRTTWKFIDNSIPTQWYTNSFVDTTWTSYTAPSTIVSVSNVQLFRKNFMTPITTNQESFEIRFRSRAGSIIYLNGNEVYRQYLPTGALTLSTTPTGGDETVSWRSVVLPVNLLSNSTENVLALGIVNLPFYLNTAFDFDCYVTFLPFTGSYSRNFDLTYTSSYQTTTTKYLFDQCYGSTYTANCLRGETVSITSDYGEYRAEYINKYCITSSSDRKKDPNDWLLYGSTDNTEFILIANETNVQFTASKQTLCFYIVDNVYAYRTYKITLLEPYLKEYRYYYYMSELSYTTIDFTSMTIPPFSVSPTTIEAIAGSQFPSIVESNDIYRDYKITPDLPAPLELDTTTGNIRGIVAYPFESDYSLSARGLDGQRHSLTIHIRVTACPTSSSLITVEFETGVTGYEQGFYLYTGSTSSSIMQYSSLLPNEHLYFHTCSVGTQFKLLLTDMNNDGWSGSTYSVYVDHDILLATGTVYEGEAPKTIPINTVFLLNPKTTEWKYNYESVESSWTSVSSVSQSWTSGSLNTYPKSTAITNYYTYNLPIQSGSYSAIQFSIQNTQGIIIYINGDEVYRANLPKRTHITSETYASRVSNSTLTSFTYTVEFGSYDVTKSNLIGIEIHRTQRSQTNQPLSVGVSLVTSGSSRITNGYLTGDIMYDYYSVPNYLIDGDISSVLVNGPRCVGATYTYTFFNEGTEFINGYSITNGYDCNKRTPSSWTIYASMDPSTEDWVVLDKQVDQFFTAHTQTKQYKFMNTIAYNSIKFVADACNNNYLDSYSTYCTQNTWGSAPGFGLAELKYFSQTLPDACKKTNLYAATLNGEYSYRECDALYVGTYQSRCSNGVFLQEENNCVPDIPKAFNYTNRILDLYVNTPITPLIPTIVGVEYKVSVVPNLPSGLQLNPMTGVITGTPTTESISQIYKLTCTTKSGSASYTLLIQVTTPPTPSYLIWIVPGVIAIIIILILVLCIINRTKKSSRTHKKLNEQSAKRESNRKSSSTKSNSNTKKAVHI